MKSRFRLQGLFKSTPLNKFKFALSTFIPVERGMGSWKAFVSKVEGGETQREVTEGDQLAAQTEPPRSPHLQMWCSKL